MAVFFIVSLSLVTTAMIMEYLSFRRSAEKLVHIRKDYQTYLQELQEKLEELNARALDFEKKNANELMPLKHCEAFHSSHESLADRSMLLIDRSFCYLKRSALAHARKYAVCDELRSLYDVGQSVTVDEHCQTMPIVHSAIHSSDGKLFLHVPNFFVQWPIAASRYWISSFFGPRKKKDGTWGFHYGLDMAALKGTPVHAVAAGKVIEVSYAPRGFGKCIVIKHDNRYKTRYAHLDEILVSEGQLVAVGQLIGKVGDTGAVRGKNASHLHLEVMEFGKRINPLYIL